MSILKVKQGDCCGCMACAQACFKEAIAITEDAKGFIYPKLDAQRCVDCNLCERVCPAIARENRHHGGETQEIYGCVLQDEAHLQHVASGGVITEIANWILAQGGVVVGAVLDEEFRVIHKGTQVQQGVQSGSKYVQSDTSRIYGQVKEWLKQGKTVLFTGTPCQVDAVKQFCAGKLEKQLYTVDILCRGVPSYKIFRSYLTWLENLHGPISTYNFRDRSLGRHGSNVRVTFLSREELVNTKEVNLYDSLYGRGYLMRLNCYHCPYTSLDRVGDLSAGDFWGVEKVRPEWDEKNGVSLVLVNNAKGKELWDAVKNAMEYFQVQPEDAMQPCLKTPREKPADYNGFWRCYKTRGFAAAGKLYGKYGWRSDLHKDMIYYWTRIQNKLKR